MRSSKIRGEIVLQKFPRENGFRAENPGKKRPSPLKKNSDFIVHPFKHILKENEGRASI